MWFSPCCVHSGRAHRPDNPLAHPQLSRGAAWLRYCTTIRAFPAASQPLQQRNALQPRHRHPQFCSQMRDGHRRRLRSLFRQRKTQEPLLPRMISRQDPLLPMWKPALPRARPPASAACGSNRASRHATRVCDACGANRLEPAVGLSRGLASPARTRCAAAVATLAALTAIQVQMLPPAPPLGASRHIQVIPPRRPGRRWCRLETRGFFFYALLPCRSGANRRIRRTRLLHCPMMLLKALQVVARRLVAPRLGWRRSGFHA